MLRGLTFLLGSLLACAVHAGGAFVRLLPSAEVAAPVVQLAAIAAIESDDEALVRELEGVEIIRLQAGEATKQLARDEVERRVLTALPERALHVAFGGASRIRLDRPTTRHALDELFDRAAAAVFLRMPGATRIDLKRLGARDAVALPPGTVSYRVDARNMLRTGALVEVPVDILVDAAFAGRVLARFELRAAGPARADRDEQATVSRIRRNDPVAVRVQSGGVVIQSEGYALNGAETGDVVRVRRNGSNDVLTGRLLASGAVGIHE
jgi:hypothetical protein